MRTLSAIAAALVATAAFGYLLPAYSILRRMTDPENIVAWSWRIEGSMSLYGQTAKDAAAALKTTVDSNELQVDGVVSLRMPGRCRFEAVSADGTAAAAISSGGKARTEGGAIPAMQVAIDQACAMLGSRSSGEGEGRAAVERQLQKLGIDGRRVSLARFGGQVAYVLGDPAENKPQFWIFKDVPKEKFPPARVRFSDGQGQWDVRFLDYTSPATGEAFPRVVEVWKGGELQLRFTALKAEPKAQLADKLF